MKYQEVSMLDERANPQYNALKAWVEELFHGPQQSAGDYFERLRINIESSAPVCTSCHS